MTCLMFGRNESPNCLLWGMGSLGQLRGGCHLALHWWWCWDGVGGGKGKVESGRKTTEQWVGKEVSQGDRWVPETDAGGRTCWWLSAGCLWGLWKVDFIL